MVTLSFGVGFAGTMLIDMSDGEEAFVLYGKTTPVVIITMIKDNKINLNLII